MKYFWSFRRYSKLNRLLEIMPKDTAEHVERNQKQRMKIREKSKFYSPGTVNLQVLGSGARGTSACIYLFSEQSRYLFNCGEGTQRLAHEHRTKLTRMEHVFLTRTTWNRFGGVPGLCLTLQEIGVPKLHLHGPPGIDRIFESARKFVVLKNMKVETPECKDGDYHEDSVLKVFYVPIHKESSGPEQIADEASDDLKSEEMSTDEIDYFGFEGENQKKDNQGGCPKKTKNVRPPLKIQNSVVAFICKLQPRSGTLDLQKCVEKGVRPGPLLGRLKNGFDVNLPDGSVVKADEVRGPASPGSVFIFIDIPNEGYLKSLLSSEKFKPYQKYACTDEDVAMIVVHFCSLEMMENSLYKEWINEFSASTRHWFVNERNEFSGYFASHRIQRQLNEIDANIFPMLKEPHPYLHEIIPSEYRTVEPPEKIFKIDVEASKAKPIDEKFADNAELGILSLFHVRPPKGFDRNLEPYSNPEKVAEETMATPDLKELITAFKQKAKELVSVRSKAERDEEFPKIITFGTGSCIPNKTRNVSANLIHVSKDSCFLLDCGEGTLGQIIRFYGRDGADEVLRKMRMIYISHLHADHHLGLIDIISRRRLLTDEKVLLLAPSQISAWLDFYNFGIEEIHSTYDLFNCNDLLGWNIDDEEKEELYKRLGIVRIDTCFVKHCPYSYGVSFEMKNLMRCSRYPGETIKITYSGDTLPCDSLVAIGQNSDVLIHEATMEDNLEKEAAIKMHSTISQAIDIGRRMNAKFVILTHFSQRYAKIPLMQGDFKNVAIGFDNMEVTLNDLPMMHLMYEPLKVMFSEHFELISQKAFKRKCKEERKIEINMPNGNQHNKVKKFTSSDED